MLYYDKRVRLNGLVDKLKPRLERLWDELRTKEGERQSFFNNQVEDELYMSMLTEVARLEMYLESIRPLLKMIARREWIKSEMHSFENKASNPDRLFRNSSQLLNEEKFRKIVATEFPKLTDDLRKQIAIWEQQNVPQRIIYASYPYLDTMNEEKECPEFSLMHLRLLKKKTAGTDVGIADLNSPSSSNVGDSSHTPSALQQSKLALKPPKVTTSTLNVVSTASTPRENPLLRGRAHPSVKKSLRKSNSVSFAARTDRLFTISTRPLSSPLGRTTAKPCSVAAHSNSPTKRLLS